MYLFNISIFSYPLRKLPAVPVLPFQLYFHSVLCSFALADVFLQWTLSLLLDRTVMLANLKSKEIMINKWLRARFAVQLLWNILNHEISYRSMFKLF